MGKGPVGHWPAPGVQLCPPRDTCLGTQSLEPQAMIRLEVGGPGEFSSLYPWCWSDGPQAIHTCGPGFMVGWWPLGVLILHLRRGVGPWVFTLVPVPFLPWAGQWMETGTSGQAGAPALPAAPRAGSSARGSATGPHMGVPSARATGWRAETASCSSAQVSAARGDCGWGPGRCEPWRKGEARGS